MPSAPAKIDLEKAFGPKMRGLKPSYRTFVSEFAKCRNATEAARRAGFQAKGSGLRSVASRLLDRDDIAQAVVEETLRRLKADLPVNLGLVQSIATGEAGTENRPVSHQVRLKALEMMVERAAPATLRVEQDIRVEVTVRDRWEKLCRMAVARGEDPEVMIRNLPEADRIAVLAALQTPASVTDAQTEEVES